MDTSTLLLVFGCAAISLASRAWRSSGLPWGLAALGAAAVGGFPFLFFLLTATVLLLAEAVGRPRVLLGALVAIAVPLAFWTPAHLALSSALTRLTILFVAAHLAWVGTASIVKKDPARPRSSWPDIANTLILLASAALVLTGVDLSLPLLSVLGLAVPAVLPARIRQTLENQSARVWLKSFSDLSGWAALFRKGSSTPSLEALARTLHRNAEPVFHHALTIVATNPATRITQSFIAAHPDTGEVSQRIEERIRFFFQSGRLPGANGQHAHDGGGQLPLDPGFRNQLLVPIQREDRPIALVAFLANTPLPAPREVPRFCDSVQNIVLHLLTTIEEHRRLVFLTQRTEKEGQRLRSLLELNHLIATSADLRTLTNNLVRTVSISFGLTWTGFLLPLEGGRSFKLVAWSGDAEDWEAPHGSRLTIASDKLASVLETASRLSRFLVLPIEAWPLPVPRPPNVDHVLVIPIEHGDRIVAYVQILPSSMRPMPDLEDLRALEILMDQVGPVVASGLHLEKVSRRTLQDALTGIANRRSLDRYFDEVLTAVREDEGRAAFAMLDIDDFKLVNDRHGHRVGDVVLVEIARILESNVRAEDFVARYGGEEFAIVLPGLSAERACDVLERLRQSIAGHRFAAGELKNPLSLTLSIGVSSFPDDGLDASSLMETADMALYCAKRRGKNRVVAARDVSSQSALEDEEPFAL